MRKRGRPRTLTDEQRREHKRRRERNYYHRNREKIALRRMALYLQNPTPVLERGRRYHAAHREAINQRHRANKARITSLHLPDGVELSAPAMSIWQDTMQFTEIMVSLTPEQIQTLGMAMDYDFDENVMPDEVRVQWQELRMQLLDMLR